MDSSTSANWPGAASTTQRGAARRPGGRGAGALGGQGEEEDRPLHQARRGGSLDDGGARYQVGELVNGTITKIAPFGAFARIEDGVEGLIHLSELPAGVQDPKAVLEEGQEVQVRILRIDAERRRLGLSIRQADENAPLEESSASPSAEDASTEARNLPEQREVGAGAAAEAGPVPTPAATTPPARGRPAVQEEPPTAMATAFQAALAQQQAHAAEPEPKTAATAEPHAGVDAVPEGEAASVVPAEEATSAVPEGEAASKAPESGAVAEQGDVAGAQSEVNTVAAEPPSATDSPQQPEADGAEEAVATASSEPTVLAEETEQTES